MRFLRIRARLTILVGLAAAAALAVVGVASFGLFAVDIVDYGFSLSSSALADTESAVENRIADFTSVLERPVDDSTASARTDVEVEIRGLEAEIEAIEEQIDAIDSASPDEAVERRSEMQDQIVQREDRIREWQDRLIELDGRQRDEQAELEDQLRALEDHDGRSEIRFFDGAGNDIEVGDLADRVAGSDGRVELARAVCRTLAGGIDCEVTNSGDPASASAVGTLDRLTGSAAEDFASDIPAVTIGSLDRFGDDLLITLVSQDVSSTVSQGSDVASFLLVAVPVLALLLAGVTWLAVGRALRPVQAMTDQVARIGDDSLDRQIPVPAANDELRRLATTMNDMLGRLHQSQDRQRRFISDASHELRSPITATQATLEVVRASPDEVDWQHTTSVLHEENARLASLVDDLLLLARLDEQRVLTGTIPVDVDELCLAEAERPHRVNVQVRVVAPVRVSGNLSMLTRAVRNLVDNAVAHATSTVVVQVGSGVDVGSEAPISPEFPAGSEFNTGRPMAVVRVEDDGPGIPPDRRSVVFERFARLDEARNRSEGGGAGLGLAIVDTIARNHGGSARVEDSSLGGACLVLSLPIEPPTPRPE